MIKIRNMRLYFTLIILSVFVSGYSQTSTIKYFDTKIEIDGKFNEQVWSQIPENTNFYNYLPTDIGLAENQTSVKLFHNGEYLYVSATYFDSSK